MRSRELIPCEPLRPYVRLFWILELDEPGAFGPPERIAPDGLLELVFHYREPFACRYDGEPFAPQPRSVAVSQTRRFVEIAPGGASGLVSVRFQPWGAWQFVDRPLSELADRQTPLAELWGRAAVELEERLTGAGGDRERIALVERFLLDRLARHRKADVEPLVRAVWRRRGRGAISRLGDHLGIGERRLQRTFAAALGTSPKGYARLTRFLHACSLLRRPRREPGTGSLAELALECGYYDQSHFGAEFKAFSGLTPARFARRDGLSFLELD